MADFEQIVWDDELEADWRRIVRLAVREELDRGFDLTTVCLISPEVMGVAGIGVRESGRIAGLAAVPSYLDELQVDVAWQPMAHDGDVIDAPYCVGQLRAPAAHLLTLERTLLNLLGHLSGIATMTHRYVDQIAGTSARIYDTRKTTPGWRRLEKYAVRCGGGFNHRRGLDDAVLIKDNHLAVLQLQGKSPVDAVELARQQIERVAGRTDSRTVIEIEVDTLEQFESVLPTRPDIILLDNMPPELLAKAVDRRDQIASGVLLEASGGITLETIRPIAESGVDRISIGALTHSSPALDIGLDWSYE